MVFEKAIVSCDFWKSFCEMSTTLRKPKAVWFSSCGFCKKKLSVSLSYKQTPHVIHMPPYSTPSLFHEWIPFARIFFFLLTVHRSALLHIQCSTPARAPRCSPPARLTGPRASPPAREPLGPPPPHSPQCRALAIAGTGEEEERAAVSVRTRRRGACNTPCPKYACMAQLST